MLSCQATEILGLDTKGETETETNGEEINVYASKISKRRAARSNWIIMNMSRAKQC